MPLTDRLNGVVVLLRKNSAAVRWEKSIATCALYFRVHLCVNNLIAVLLSTFDGTLALGCAVSVTTVGYGAFVPTTDSVRVFTCFYLLFGIAFVLTAAVDVAKFVIARVQRRLLLRINSSDNMVFKEMNKMGLSFLFLLIAVLMGTCFFAINEEWTAAQAFYWTIVTMTTVGYGDLKLKHDSSRQFSIFFIVYCVLVFAIAIQNINESYGEVKAYRGRISVALAMQSRSAVFTSSHNNTPGGTPDDGDMIEDGHMDITEMNVRRDMKNVFCVSDFISGKASKSDTSLAAKMDCNEFVIEVLLRCNAIDYDTDLEPILTHLRGVNIGADGMISREEIAKFYLTRMPLSSSSAASGNGNGNGNGNRARFLSGGRPMIPLSTMIEEDQEVKHRGI